MQYADAVFASYIENPQDALFRAAWADTLLESGEDLAASFVRGEIRGITAVHYLAVVTTKSAWVEHGGTAVRALGLVRNVIFADAEPISAMDAWSWRLDDGKWNVDTTNKRHALALVPAPLFNLLEGRGDSPWVNYGTRVDAATALESAALTLWKQR